MLKQEKKDTRSSINNFKKNLSGSMDSNTISEKVTKQVKEQKLNDLNKKRAELRKVLQEYQNDFMKKHERKIKFHKDILPVERE